MSLGKMDEMGLASFGGWMFCHLVWHEPLSAAALVVLDPAWSWFSSQKTKKRSSSAISSCLETLQKVTRWIYSESVWFLTLCSSIRPRTLHQTPARFLPWPRWGMWHRHHVLSLPVHSAGLAAQPSPSSAFLSPLQYHDCICSWDSFSRWL